MSNLTQKLQVIGNRTRSLAVLVGTGAVALTPCLAHAAAGYTLPTSGATGILQNIETTMSQIANFVSQPLGVFVVIVAFIFAACLWIFSPRSGALSYAFRAVAALVVVFNLTAIISYFTYA